jgi:hypothetical protein
MFRSPCEHSSLHLWSRTSTARLISKWRQVHRNRQNMPQTNSARKPATAFSLDPMNLAPCLSRLEEISHCLDMTELLVRVHTRRGDFLYDENARRGPPSLIEQNNVRDTVKAVIQHTSSIRCPRLRIYCEARSSGRSVGRMCSVGRLRESSGVRWRKVREAVCYQVE